MKKWKVGNKHTAERWYHGWTVYFHTILFLFTFSRLLINNVIASAFQESDGLFGALVVRRQEPPNIRSLYDYDLPEHTFTVWHWYDKVRAYKNISFLIKEFISQFFSHYKANFQYSFVMISSCIEILSIVYLLIINKKKYLNYQL